MMDVIIMAGGDGTRMGSDLPKPLVPVNGVPMLEHLLDYFKKFACVNKIILAVNDRVEFKDFVKKKNYDDVVLSVEKSKLGTGGATKLALRYVASDFVLVLNSDDFADVDIDRLSELNDNHIIVSHPRLPFALIEEDEAGFIKYVEKPLLPQWVSIGWYYLKLSDLKKYLFDICSLEYDVLPELKLKMFKHEGFWFPLNSKKQINEFESSGKHL